MNNEPSFTGEKKGKETILLTMTYLRGTVRSSPGKENEGGGQKAAISMLRT